ncbi:DUF1611 domain-containing protein [Acetobacterium woodii]|uniref:EBNA-1 nuclear protein n=1 Tax=Acetobacterium woodii (strain ATCC 29683 / DSM 1030 / JCM 2381 / KCTC 1655 / WB1) TaxID=931626 RepID=H6LG73_ACEWD|nr:DUF1611 domain-containing protein [Acetobacterium woodii]AFA49549.1 hypothetical protein Awo_c27980 [Acetobacterium woodii DSM 1030]
MKEKALLYCEGQFGESDGKTANGLIRRSQKYHITCVIDSTKAGMDAGKVLQGIENGIPIYRDITAALDQLTEVPKYFIYGIAPKDAILSTKERRIFLQAMSLGMDIVNGLHEFISEDAEFKQQAKRYRVKLFDIRKPLANRYLHLFTGDILKVKTPTIAILGTDCAVGKRTTAMLLITALKERGLRASFIGTGQTSLIQGEKYGIALDAIPSEFMTGELENAVVEADVHEKPDVIILEGQGALSHPAFISSCAIIRGGKPDAIIVQHPPKRKRRVDFDYLQMPTLSSEIELLEQFSQAKVIAVTLNHDQMTEIEIKDTIKTYEQKYHLPTTDPLFYGCNKLVKTIIKTFPELKEKITH